MADVSGVPGITDPSATEQTQQQISTTEATTATTLPANASVGQLASTAKPVLNAIMWAIANNIRDMNNQSNQRIHDILADADSDNK
jgi:hypothetical protein